MIVTQAEYQAQVTAGLENSHDDAILTVKDVDHDGLEDTEAEDTEITEETEIDEQPEENLTQSEDVYTKEQVQSIVRTRVANYEKRLEKYKQSEAALDRIAEVSGLSKEQLVVRLNTMSDTEQAQILGVPVEQVSAMRAQRGLQIENEKQIRKLNRDLELTQLKADKNYGDIDLFMEDILAKVEDHPSLALKDAYTLVKGELGITAKVRDAEQRVINSQAKAKNKKLVNPVGGANPQPKGLSQEVVSNAKRLGMDPNQYNAFKEIDNIDAYRAYKKAQKGEK